MVDMSCTVIGVNDIENKVLGEHLSIQKADSLVSQYLPYYDLIEVIKDEPKPVLVKCVKNKE